VDDIGRFLQNSPHNWGRWGPDDEIGAVNFLGVAEVLRGIASVVSGQVFTLGQMIRNPRGDLVGGFRKPPEHNRVNGTLSDSAGVEYADDTVSMYTHGGTHMDALAHIWYDGKMYNGYEAEAASGTLARNGVHQVAGNGIVGRAVLLDVARYKGVEWLPEGAEITLEDLLKTAEHQKLTIDKRDILLVRTGYYLSFLKNGYDEYFKEDGSIHEPGITYTEELAQWFYEREIPVYGTDTLGSEQTHSTRTGTTYPLHPYLITRLGVTMVEHLWLEDLADACAADGRYLFFLTIGALKLVGGTGSPINPIAIR
jgi:kynurenine formamidase